VAEAHRFHPDAERELEEAADWYESQREGLGGEFIAAVRAKIGRIVEAPERYPVTQGARRALVGRFPYAIVYTPSAASVQGVLIIAVAHLRRRPKYWIGR
jgi:plasmid stabilization system protein ParE